MHFDIDLGSWAGHGISIGTLFSALLGFAPAAAAVVAFVWYGIQIYESKTFQDWKRSIILKRRAKKLAKLRAREKIVTAQIEALEIERAAKVEASELVKVAAADAAKLVVRETTEAAVKTTVVPPK